MYENYKLLKKLEKKIHRLCGEFIVENTMIVENDRILVGLSGGKDSYTLFDILLHFKKVSPINFEIIPAYVNTTTNNNDEHIISEFTESRGHKLISIKEDISQVINKNIKSGKNPCSLCSRIRRGAIYTMAENNKCTKVALGHHKNDLIETFLLNSFYNGTIATMSVNYSTAKKGIRLIRPLGVISEKQIIDYSKNRYDKFITRKESLCPFVENENKLKRSKMKKVIEKLKTDIPEIENSIFASLSNIHEDEMLIKKRDRQEE